MNLKKTGYVDRNPVRDNQTKKITHWETVVRESVDTPTSEPLTQNLHVGKVDVGNGNLLSTKELSTNKDHSPAKAERIPFKEIIEYLNEQTGRRYSHTANKNQDLIRARWNEGFRVEDFKRVIDTKVKDWGNDSKMNQYLRPVTLFSNKFDDYLNQEATDESTSVIDDLWEA